MPATINDVAKYAGVSSATASRVINNDTSHRVRPETAKLVLDAVIALDYHPNENARKLRQRNLTERKAPNFGVLLTSVGDSYSDNFFYDILLGIQSEAALCGYTISFSYSLSNTSPKTIIESLTNFNVDGVILLGRMNADILFTIKKNVKHIIYAGLNPVNQMFDEVVCNGYECAKLAVKYLASCGYKKIGFIGTAASGGSSALINEYRYEGYLNALKELGLEFYKEYVIDTPLNVEMSYNALNAKLPFKIMPDAFFCANDYCAIGALKALHMHRIHVPKKIGLIGIDDIDISAYSRPMLTTIRIPRQEIGKYSVRILADQIQTNRKYPLKVELPYELIVRETCRKPL